MRFRFCPNCGAKLIERYSWDEGGVPYCEFDDMMFFDTPKPCIIVAVIKGDQILLLKQSYIFKDSKVLISGYVTNGESVEETVCREVKEETGINVGDIKYLGSEALTTKDILMLTFMARYIDGEIKKSSEVEWVDWSCIANAVSEMREDEIGKRIVRKVLRELGYTDEQIYGCEKDSY